MRNTYIFYDFSLYIKQLDSYHFLYFQYKPLIKKGMESFVHHLLVFQCYIEGNSEAFYQKWVGHHGAQCFSPDMPKSWLSCRYRPIIVWAIGSEG